MKNLTYSKMEGNLPAGNLPDNACCLSFILDQIQFQFSLKEIKNEIEFDPRRKTNSRHYQVNLKVNYQQVNFPYRNPIPSYFSLKWDKKFLVHIPDEYEMYFNPYLSLK